MGVQIKMKLSEKRIVTHHLSEASLLLANLMPYDNIVIS